MADQFAILISSSALVKFRQNHAIAIMYVCT